MNTLVQEAFGELEHKKSNWQKFGKAADRFWTTLQEKASTITKFRIVPLSQEAYDTAFIPHLSERAGYDYLGDIDERKKLCAKEKALREAFTKTLEARIGQRDRDERTRQCMFEEWRVGGSLPVQIRIAGLPGNKDTPQETRRGCVVFLLGTESVAGVRRPGSENGFYTELPHIVQMYEDLIRNVAERFTIKHAGCGCGEN